MQNSLMQRTGTRAVLAMVTILIAAGGCADNNRKSRLDQVNSAYQAHQYSEAIAASESFTRDLPTGPGTATALYLKGRAIEQNQYTSKAEAIAAWQQAGEAYTQALAAAPSAKLKPLIHAGLGNVAYFLDDYAAAAMQWTTAYDKFTDEQAKSWVLYRIGLCRQRLGQFSDADAVFAAVIERYPNSIPAQRAREHQGVRTFSVQLATFASPSNADAALNELKRSGVVAAKQVDRQGRSVIMVGPVPSYQQAQVVKSRLAGIYPDALIVP